MSEPTLVKVESVIPITDQFEPTALTSGDKGGLPEADAYDMNDFLHQLGKVFQTDTLFEVTKWEGDLQKGDRVRVLSILSERGAPDKGAVVVTLQSLDGQQFMMTYNRDAKPEAPAYLKVIEK